MNPSKIKLLIIFLIIISSVSYMQVKDKPFTQEYHKPYSLSTKAQNDVRAIAVDNLDNVWAGTKAGLFKLDKSTCNWDSILDSLNQGPINDLFIDSKGILWVAAWNGLFVIENLVANKIPAIIGPIGVVSEVNKSIIAMGPEGIWQKENEEWSKKNIPYSKAVRKLTPDGKNGYYLATGKGLYHKNKNQIKLFQKEDEILSDNIYGLDFSEDGNLWAGGLGGVSVYRNDKWIKTYTPKDGLPNIWVN